MTKLNSSKNDFERNSVDVFTLTLTNVGEMQRVRIGHDNWGMGADWHLKLVGGVGPWGRGGHRASGGGVRVGGWTADRRGEGASPHERDVILSEMPPLPFLPPSPRLRSSV